MINIQLVTYLLYAYICFNLVCMSIIECTCMHHFVWADQRPVQGNISYIALQPGQYKYCPGRNQGNIYNIYIYISPGKVVSLIHTLIFRMLQKKLAIIYIVELVTFTGGMELCILTIIKNAIVFIVADKYE